MSDKPDYYDGPEPTGPVVHTGFEQASMMCNNCRETVGIILTKGSIEHVANMNVQNKVIYLCNSCYEKLGMAPGKLSKAGIP